MALLLTSRCSTSREAHVGGCVSVAMGVSTGNGKFAVTVAGSDMVDCRVSEDNHTLLFGGNVAINQRERRKADETMRN